ncbi:MAG: AmmeMemoRadiSam system radical SAM enzyme [Nitrospira sp.]|nr:AmmeMemoRadiSam system radical SAM enzyme [Nitrospira sp.]MCW5782855.1 AmmeMemoRadiSam system radical SAM enzyme [Nitrospirales bacterium]
MLTTYDRSSGFCVDRIEKKLFNRFLPRTLVLSFGAAGCNLACKLCQNWDRIKPREMDNLADAASPQSSARETASSGCRSVAFTYNDRVIFHEYAIDVFHDCHEVGVKTVAVTAGYVCEKPQTEFHRDMDAVNDDLKAFMEAFYHPLTNSHLQPVLETLEYSNHHTNVWLEITTLLIPARNDSEAGRQGLTRWVVEYLGPDVPLHFSTFLPDFKMLARHRIPSSTLSLARSIAMNKGLQNVDTGNLHVPATKHP